MAFGQIHHLEIYVSDLKKSSDFWGWFLDLLGYRRYQKWSEGISYKLENTYIVFVQVKKKYLSNSFHRCHPGLNHLAFYGKSREHIDQLTVELQKKGISILYQDKHPYAGGNDSYSVYFEDPDRIKVELVAT